MRPKMAFIAMILLAVTMGLTLVPPAAAQAEPAVAAGWHASSIVVSAGANPVRFEGGVLLIGAWEGSVDAYLVGTKPTDPAIRSTMSGAAPSWATSLDRGLVAYFATRPLSSNPYSRDLYLKDLGTEEVIRLTRDTLTHEGPEVDRGRVTWWSWGPTKVPEIMLYDFATSIEQSVTPNPTRANKEPDLGGNYIAWQQWTGSSYRVLCRNLLTRETLELDTGLPWARQPLPQVDAGWVMWNGLDQGADVVRVYKLADGSKIEIANDSAMPPTRAGTLEGDLVVFYAEDPAPADGADEPAAVQRQELYVHNLNTGQTRLLAENQSRQWVVDGGLVAWETVVPSAIDPAVTETAIQVWDSSTDQITELVRGPAYHLALMDRGRIAFTELLEDQRTAIWLAVKDDAPAYGYYLDVYPEDPNHEAIAGLTDLGAVGGVTTGEFRTFQPRHPLKRAQFAKMMAILLELQVNEELTSPFTDLGRDETDSLYPHEYVAAAYLGGITNGKTATTFAPWSFITRAQLVTMTVRALEKRVVMQDPSSGFVPTIGFFSKVHSPNMTKAEYWGLLHGIEGFGSSWDPEANATRAEAAQVLWNLHALVTAE